MGQDDEQDPVGERQHPVPAAACVRLDVPQLLDEVVQLRAGQPRRGDFCAQTAARITAKNALVVLEDLKTKNMSASASGSVESPGVRVAQKRGLNRAILDKGWHRLELALTSAARYTGTRVVKVNPAYTSQRCSACGLVTEN
ncbi:zinc ribbon domain-containing protein, partial [Streptomyces sp. NPDC002758]